MAGKTANTALQTAMQGGKVSDKAAHSALGQAVDRIANLTKRANQSKETMMETGTLVLHVAETQGSLFLSSMAEGYWGEDKMKLGSVDLRAPVGLVAQGYGLYQTMSGQRAGGAHMLAIGNGVMGSWLASVARNAGRTLAEKRESAAAPPAAAPPPAVPGPVVLQGAPMLMGPSLLPEPVAAGDEELGRRFGPGARARRRNRRMANRPHRGGRFVRPAPDEDDGADDDLT